MVIPCTDPPDARIQSNTPPSLLACAHDKSSSSGSSIARPPPTRLHPDQVRAAITSTPKLGDSPPSPGPTRLARRLFQPAQERVWRVCLRTLHQLFVIRKMTLHSKFCNCSNEFRDWASSPVCVQLPWLLHHHRCLLATRHQWSVLLSVVLASWHSIFFSAPRTD